MDRTWTRTPPRGCVRPSVCLPPMIPGRRGHLVQWDARNVSAPVPPPLRLLASRRGGGGGPTSTQPLAKTSHPEMTRSLYSPAAGIWDRSSRDQTTDHLFPVQPPKSGDSPS
jgi:hypothetical protein